MEQSQRWKPPDARRVPINIHPNARRALYELLLSPLFMGTGIGYSEFIMRCVREARSAAEASHALQSETEPIKDTTRADDLQEALDYLLMVHFGQGAPPRKTAKLLKRHKKIP